VEETPIDREPGRLTGPVAARAAWLAYWKAMRSYHRFEVTGLANLERPGAALIVGYHGRPFAHDLCMFQSFMADRTGAMPHAVIHEAFARIPVLRWLVESGAFVTGDGEEMRAILARGERVIVTPGGTREGLRSFRDRYRVNWGGRLGYVRLALKYGLSIIPTASAGVDDAYLGLNDGHAWGRRLPGGFPLWLGVGPLGLWPLSPPFPVKITLHVGEPIALGKVEPDDRAGLLALHARVTGAVQALLDGARARR
jgi:1-acyl-sn-glycerol-3-phosphate acyltransferase